MSEETHINDFNDIKARNFGEIIIYIAIVTYTEKHKIEYISELWITKRTFNSLRSYGYIAIDQNRDAKIKDLY